jgi:hypothetical protein
MYVYVHNRRGLSESEQVTVICNLIFISETLFCADELPSGSESAYLSVGMISVCHFLPIMVRSAGVLVTVFDLYVEYLYLSYCSNVSKASEDDGNGRGV